MKTLKRPLSILLTVLMLVSMVTVGTVAVNAVDEAYDDGTGMDYRDWLQYDDRWASIPLGDSPYTMGSAGCTLTSICKLIIQTGLAKPTELNPGIMAKWLNNHKGFTTGTYNVGGYIYWDEVQSFCEEVLGKKFTINTSKSKSSYPSSDVGAYDWVGSGEQYIFDESSYIYTDDTTDNAAKMEANRKRIKALMEAGYHLVINVHAKNHWIAVDEIATKACNYEHIYIANSWIKDGTVTRTTLEDYLAVDAKNSQGESYGTVGRFQRIAAYKTVDSDSTVNAYDYAKTDEYKSWSRKDPRWATTVLDEFTTSGTYATIKKADYVGDWGQALLALNKELIQAGVKNADDNPNVILDELKSDSLIGSTDGIINWADIKNLDSTKIKESGVAYGEVTISSKKSEMLKKMKEEGYHYIVQTDKGSNVDDAWVAIDEEKSINEGKLYKLSSNLPLSSNTDSELTGSAKSIKYFKTEPTYAPVTFSGTNAEITATADGSSIESGDYVKLGSEITVTAVPDEDYKLDKWTVNSTDVDEASNTYTFTLEEETNVVYTAKAATVVYLNNSALNDTEDNIVWYAWTHAKGAADEEGEWVKGVTDSKTGYLKFSDVNEELNFVRMKTTKTTVPSWEARTSNGSNTHQTPDLTTESGNVYVLTAWDNGTGLHNFAGAWSEANTVYLYPKAINVRANDYTANYYAWTWGTGDSGSWAERTVGDDGIITFTGVKENVQFYRINGSTPATSGDSVWGETVNLTVDTSEYGDMFVLNKYIDGKMSGEWANKSDIKDVTYKYWTKTDPRWNSITYGDSTARTGTYTQAQTLAKLSVQAGVKDWDPTDCTITAFPNNGDHTWATDYALLGLRYVSYTSDNNGISMTNDKAKEIYNEILDGKHIVLRLPNTGLNDWVIVDEEKTISENIGTDLSSVKIYVIRSTDNVEDNVGSFVSSTISGAVDTKYTRKVVYEGGATPGHPNDEDYRTWSRFDRRWKNDAVGDKGEYMYNNGACIVAVAKMFVQAGVKSVDNFTPEDLLYYLDNLPRDVGLTSDGSLLWGSVNNYVSNTLEFDTTYTSGVVYLKFANPINGREGYPRRSASYDGTGVYSMAEEADTIMEAIRQGYHMLIEVKNKNNNIQSWVVVDEAESLKNGKVVVMDSLEDTTKNADVDVTTYESFYRIVGYKGATTPIVNEITEEKEVEGETVTVTVPAVSLVADENDPAYVGVKDNVFSYVYGTSGDVNIVLKNASKAQDYYYYLADSKEELDAVTAADFKKAESQSYSDGTVTINIKNAVDAKTAADSKTKYVAVKAVNGTAESNTVTAEMKYKTVGLNYGFTSTGATIKKGETVDYNFNAAYTDGTAADNVEITPTFTYSEDAEEMFNMSEKTFTSSETGIYSATINSVSATLTKGSNEKTVAAAYVNIDPDTFTVTVNETQYRINFYTHKGDPFPYYSVGIEKNDEAGTALDELSYYKAAPELDGYVFEGWYNYEGDEKIVATGEAATKYKGDTDLYAKWIEEGTVEKDNDDDNVLPADDNYDGFGLKGVQIRKEGKDGNFKDENGEPIVKPGGLRFITSLSQSLLDEIDSINDGEVNGDNVEYGYAVTKKEYAELFAKSYNQLDGEDIKSSYKLKNCDSNVNGINTNPSTKAEANVDNDFRYVTNVNCTSMDYSEDGVKYDHKKYDNYRLYSMVITYGETGDEINNNNDIIARAYLKYTDANGLVRYHYNTYSGNSVVCGGCCTSYNTVKQMTISDAVGRNGKESD